METLDELVATRRGYKYLSKEGISPYQGYKYSLKSKRKLVSADLDRNVNNDCGVGWNLATLKWIADNCLKLDGVIVEYSIPDDADIIVPTGSTGKFRTDIIKPKKVCWVEEMYPALKNLQKRLKKYKAVNPINATEMPDIDKIKKIMNSVGDSVRASVWASVWDLVWNSVWTSVRASVGASVRASVWDLVWNSVGDSVRVSVRASVGASVRASVRDYSYICGYHAIKEFFKLDYEHPIFDLIRMGVMVIKVKKQYEVYGKDGKHLGDIDI